MAKGKQPFVWQMIRQAIDGLGPQTTNVDVRNWVLKKYPATNPNTIGYQIIVCTVNHASRVHYPENKKPRPCDSQYDFLFRPERGRLERYDPQKHGTWEIREREDGTLSVAREDDPQDDAPARGENVFAAETHLRDYLALHLGDLEPGLQLFVDDEGTHGLEYITPVGRIDILAVDVHKNFVVIELKVGHGPDAVCGQLLRYINWVKKHMAAGKPVRGYIVAQAISDKVRYALMGTRGVELREYELALTLKAVAHVS